ncbi:MAG: alpha/beta fold hydrolase [Chloroflexota bacterium]
MADTHANGIRTNFEDVGSGPAVVFLHGHSMDQRMWRYNVPAVVEAGFRAVTYDVRGHGETEVPPSGYTWDNYAKDLAGLLDDLGIESAHVVACSMGGGIGLAFALAYPKRVGSLTLVDSALPGFGYDSSLGKEIAAMQAAFRSEGSEGFAREWLQHPFFDGVRKQPEVFALLREMVLAYPAREYQADYAGEGKYKQPDMTKKLDEIAAPALVVVGEHDAPDFRLIAEILAANVNRARLEVFAGAWHLPSMEQPERFNRVLLEFLRNDVRSSSR